MRYFLIPKTTFSTYLAREIYLRVSTLRIVQSAFTKSGIESLSSNIKDEGIRLTIAKPDKKSRQRLPKIPANMTHLAKKAFASLRHRADHVRNKQPNRNSLYSQI